MFLIVQYLYEKSYEKSIDADVRAADADIMRRQKKKITYS